MTRIGVDALPMASLTAFSIGLTLAMQGAHELGRLGAPKRRLLIKIAGGAAVLGPANAEKFKIGARNVEAIKERLKSHGLWPAAEDVGGTRGRTLELHAVSGKTFVRAAASPATEL